VLAGIEIYFRKVGNISTVCGKGKKWGHGSSKYLPVSDDDLEV
jgi:hypothetical protein